jgi:hypothetical protein
VHTCTLTYCTTYSAWSGVIHDSDEYQTCLQGVQHTLSKTMAYARYIFLRYFTLFSAVQCTDFLRRSSPHKTVLPGACPIRNTCYHMPSLRLRSAACPAVWLVVAGSWLSLGAAPCLKTKSGLPERGASASGILGLRQFGLVHRTKLLHLGSNKPPVGLRYSTLHTFLRTFISGFSRWSLGTALGYRRGVYLTLLLTMFPR